MSRVLNYYQHLFKLPVQYFLIVESDGMWLMLMCVCVPTAMFGLVSTIWFPVGAHQELGLMSFGFSLYSGWLGGALSLLGGCILTCCSINSTPSYRQNNRYSYYSKQNPPTNQTPPTGNHAKTAHV